MSVTNTFVVIAQDCPTHMGVIPVVKDDKPYLARLQYELLILHPYEYDLVQLNQTIHGLMESDKHFDESDHPCLRSSPLTRIYGWGVHYDWAGRIALYPANSIAYQKLIRDPSLKIEQAKLSGVASVQNARRNPSVGRDIFQSVA